MTDVASYDTEVESLAAMVEQARPGDVVGLMCHAERQEAYDWIAEHGGTPDDPQTLAAKVGRPRFGRPRFGLPGATEPRKGTLRP